MHRRYIDYFLAYKWSFALGAIFVILSTLSKTYTPRLVQQLIDNVIGKIKLPETSSDDIFSIVLHFMILFMGLTLISALFTFLMRQTLIVASRKIEQGLKDNMYEHIQRMDMTAFKQFTTGDLMSRLAEDIGKIREVYGPALMYLINLITTLSITIYFMLQVNSSLTFWALLPLPFLSIFVYVYNIYLYRYNKKTQETMAAMTSLAQESYNGIRIIKSFTLENKTNAQFDQISESYRDQNLKIVKIDSLFMPISVFLMSLSILITIYSGGQLYFQEKISLGNLTEFVMYVQNLTWPIMSIGWVANLVQRGKAAMSRYDEVLNTPEEQYAQNTNNIHHTGDITIKNLSYTYPDTGIQAIADVSLTIPAGQRWLIVGKTGSGKSTLAELIMQFYQDYSGSIHIGPADARLMPVDHLRSLISYIPQEVFLFSDTVRNNIAFADISFSDEKIKQTATNAQIDGEIQNFPNGYETIVGERGVTLSGGQKQRISIARALIKPSPIYIFDDCLSAVDVDTERRLIDAINQHHDHKTMIVISHRLFNQLHFDNIAVLQSGKISELGTHTELIAKGGYYAELYKRQELAATVTSLESN